MTAKASKNFFNFVLKSIKGCGEYDDRCWNSDKHDPYGGLGCNACGRPKCRFCDFDEDTHWPPCPTQSTTTSIQSTTQSTTKSTSSTTGNYHVQIFLTTQYIPLIQKCISCIESLLYKFEKEPSLFYVLFAYQVHKHLQSS